MITVPPGEAIIGFFALCAVILALVGAYKHDHQAKQEFKVDSNDPLYVQKYYQFLNSTDDADSDRLLNEYAEERFKFFHEEMLDEDRKLEEKIRLMINEELEKINK
jgi:hypothetical protein